MPLKEINRIQSNRKTNLVSLTIQALLPYVSSMTNQKEQLYYLLIPHAMFAYGSPQCPVTNSRATLFCCNADCSLPAFACSEECLIDHVNHEHRKWDLIEGAIRNITELSLGKQDIEILEKQEKRLQILFQQLKLVQQNHFKYVRQCRQRTLLREKAEKVTSAIKQRKTSIVTGSDMANLIKLFEANDIYTNRREIQRILGKKNELIDGMIAQMYSKLEDHKKKLVNLPQPQEMPAFDMIKIVPKVSPGNLVEVKGDIFTIQPRAQSQYPVFGSQPLGDGQFFEIQVVDAAKQRAFMIGLASADLRNVAGGFRRGNSLCLSAYGFLFVGGKQQKLNVQMITGDKLTVKRSGHIVQWLNGGKLLCSAPIPVELRKTHLFPVCWLCSYGNSSQISRLKFV